MHSTIDASDNIYVTEVLGNRVQKFNSDGDFLSLWEYVFNLPKGIAVDTSGYVYIVDWNGIKKFDSSGNPIQDVAIRGVADGQVKSPAGIAIDTSGNIYVADTENHRVQRFNSSGFFVKKWGSYGSGDSQFNFPNGIALDSHGNVYIVDTNNYRMQAFTPQGDFVVAWGSYGDGSGQFNLPYAAAFDALDNIYVLDNYYTGSGNRVHVFGCGGLIPSAPTFVSAESNEAGTIISITFNKAMADPTGKHGQFSYKINNGNAQGFSVAALDDDYTKINLTIGGTTIAFGDTVTVSYTAGDVKAADGGVLESFDNQPVTNNTPSPSTPEVLIDNLIGEVTGMDIPESMKSSLTPKLDVAKKVLADGNKQNDVAAVNNLKAFLNSVEAQRGKKITTEDADALIAKAQEIIAALSGGT